MVTWLRESYKPEIIAEKLDEAVQMDPITGNISSSGFVALSLAITLASMVSLDPAIPEVEKTGLVRKAIDSARRNGNITAKSLIQELGILESEYLKKPCINYILATHISVCAGYFDPILRRSIVNGSTIIFSRVLPKRFEKDYEAIRKSGNYSLPRDFPKNYQAVRVSISARTSFEAAEVAQDRLDLLRAIWNLYFNKRMAMRWSSNIRRPVNRIILAPLHTLHFPTGEMATEIFWYEPHYSEPTGALDIKAESSEMYKFERLTRKRLRKLQYRQPIELALVRYVRALDKNNWRTVFVDLWGVLEDLTGTTRRDSYDVTIKRAAFLFEESDYHSQILNHLREQRNLSVHAGTESAQLEMMIYQLKHYVEVALLFHIQNNYKFNSIADVSMMLDSKSNVAELTKQIDELKKQRSKQINLVSKAIRFRSS